MDSHCSRAFKFEWCLSKSLSFEGFSKLFIIFLTIGIFVKKKILKSLPKDVPAIMVVPQVAGVIMNCLDYIFKLP